MQSVDELQCLQSSAALHYASLNKMNRELKDFLFEIL